MADITLADYTGYIFVELIRARQMADDYSCRLALEYEQHQILKYFSVPRFKVPKMELTIPVLVSTARFYETTRFNMTLVDFQSFARGLLKDAVNAVQAARGTTASAPDPDDSDAEPLPPLPNPPPPKEMPPEPLPPMPGPDPWLASVAGVATAAAAMATVTTATDENTVENQVYRLWLKLGENSDPAPQEALVRELWPQIFQRALADAGLADWYSSHPQPTLFENSQNNLFNKVRANTGIDRTKLQSLLVNPETNVVKTGGSEASVFTIRAELQEEGLFVRSVTDEATGQESKVVEFE